MLRIVGWVVLAVVLTVLSLGGPAVFSFLLLLGAFLAGFFLVVGYQANGMTQQLQEKAIRARPPHLVTAPDKIPWHHHDEPVKYKADKRLTGATCIDTVLQECLGYLCRDYVEWFYYSVGSHPVFVHQVQLSLQQIVINFANRAKMVDWTPFFTKRIPDDFASHLRLFRLTEERLWRDRGRERLTPSPSPNRDEIRQESGGTSCGESTASSELSELEQAFFAVEERMGHCLPYRDILCSVEAEKTYLGDLSEFLLFLLLPEGDFESRILRQLLKEVMVNGVFLPTVETLCDVDYVNQSIVWLCKPSTFNTDFFLLCAHHSTSIEELEEILRQIGIESDRLRQQDSNDDPESEAKHQLESLIQLRHTCTARLERLRHGEVDVQEDQEGASVPRHGSLRLPSAAIASLPLMVVLNNHLALSHLYDFLELRPERKLTNFWVNVEAFRTSAQQVLLAKAEAAESGSTSSPDMEYVREMAMNIFDEYLSENNRLPCFDSSLCQHIWRKISTGRPTGDWFDTAQNEAFAMLERGCYREFQRSDNYAQCLAELEMASRQEEAEIVVNVEDVDDDDDDGEANSLGETSSVMSDMLTASGTYPEPVDVSAPSPSDEVAELVLSVPTYEDVRQGSKTVVYYTVQVFCRYVNQANGVTWHVLRRFSDFDSFHHQLKERYDLSLTLPTKHTFGSFDKKLLLEKRRAGLEEYVKALVSPAVVSQYPGILQLVVSFAHPGMYSKEKGELARRVTNLMKRKVKGVRSGKLINEVMRSSPVPPRRPFGGSTEKLDDAGSRPDEDVRMSATLSTEDDDNIPLRILLLLMDEVFELRTKNKWLRRHVIVILRSLVRRTFGDFINRKIIEQVEWLTSAEQIAEFVKLFRESMWPNGIIGPYAEQRDDATKIRTQTAARTMMLGSVPEELRRFIGASATECGIIRMFNMFQSKRLNRRLFYLLLEAFIETLFKDNKFPEIFKSLHPTVMDKERHASAQRGESRRLS